MVNNYVNKLCYQLQCCRCQDSSSMVNNYVNKLCYQLQCCRCQAESLTKAAQPALLSCEPIPGNTAWPTLLRCASGPEFGDRMRKQTSQGGGGGGGEEEQETGGETDAPVDPPSLTAQGSRSW